MATRGVVCSYEEVIDLSTEPEHVTVIGIHTPTGDTPRKLFRGFYDQYKKFKYLGASVSLVPAARLPADLLQVSYEGGDVIDPRDALNPLMFHGCHGDDMGVILNRLYGNNDVISDSLDGIDVAYTTPDGSAQTGLNDLEYDQLERLYYKALTDNTWKKAHPQRGFRKSGLHPLIYQLATNRQLMPGTNVDAMLHVAGNQVITAGAVGDPIDPVFEADGSPAYTYGLRAGIQNNTQFFTPRLTSLGWMDTRNVITDSVRIGEDDKPADIGTAENLQAVTQSQINYTELPKLYMGVILMSASYKVKSYYRMIINHRFAFKDFRGISFMPECSGVPSYFNANEDGIFNADVFDEIDPLDGGVTPEPDPDPEPTPDPDPEPTPTEGTLTVTRGTVTVNDPDQEMSIKLQAFNTQTQQYVDVETMYSGFASSWSGSKTATIQSNAQYRVVLTVDSVEGMLMKWTDNNSSPAPTTVEANSTATWVFSSVLSKTIVMNGTMGE